MKSRRLITSILAIAVMTWLLPATQAATVSTSFFLAQTPGYPESKLSFHGLIKPKVKNAVVRIDVQLKSGWTDTRLRTRSTSSGAWKIQTNVTALATKATYRARVTVGNKSYTTKARSITVKQVPQIT
ncbi:MAG: hypothetical protein ACKN9N_04370, partial [Actinomycetota bacterium]